MPNLFDDQLIGPTSPLYWALGALFLVLLAVALYVYLRADRRFAGHRLHLRLSRRFATLTASFAGLGLACTIFALLAVPFLSKRIWLVMAVLGLGGTAAYGYYYARRRYSAALQAYLERERVERYLPRSRRGSSRRRRAR